MKCSQPNLETDGQTSKFTSNSKSVTIRSKYLSLRDLFFEDVKIIQQVNIYENQISKSLNYMRRTTKDSKDIETETIPNEKQF